MLACLTEKSLSFLWKKKKRVNNVSLHFPLNRGDLWDVSLRCARVLLFCRVSQRCAEKKVLENISLVLGRGGAIMPATISAETRRHPSRRVGLQAVGGVPGEGQSAHLASRFVGSAPTRVLSVHRCPEKSWTNSADCCDCYTATHPKHAVPQEMRKFLNGPRRRSCKE